MVRYPGQELFKNWNILKFHPAQGWYELQVKITPAKTFANKNLQLNLFHPLLEPGPRPSWEQKPAVKSTSSSSSSYTSSWRSKFTGKQPPAAAPCSS
jgi:hypothetical protein